MVLGRSPVYAARSTCTPIIPRLLSIDFTFLCTNIYSLKNGLNVFASDDSLRNRLPDPCGLREFEVGVVRLIAWVHSSLCKPLQKRRRESNHLPM